MKLYATVTSERASKGQGGEYLDIDIYNEDKEISVRLQVRANNTGGVQVTTHKSPLYGQVVEGSQLEIGNKPYCLKCAKRPVQEGSAQLCEKHYGEAEKGEKQKGECVYNSVDGAYCTTHGTTH